MGRIANREHPLKDGRRIIIKTVEPVDAEAFIANALVIFESSDQVLTCSEEFNMTVEEERKWLETNLIHERSLVLAALCDGKIVGNLTLQGGHRKKISHTAELGMGIAPNWRGKGIGKILLTTVIHWAKNNPNLEKINLSVFETNQPAIKLYRNLGFVEEGRRKNQFRQKNGEYADEIMMSLTI